MEALNRAKKIVLHTCCATALLLVTSSHLQAQESGVSTNGTFSLALAGEPQTFDPAAMFRVIEGRVVVNLFEGLYMPPEGEGPPVERVAIGHEVSDDGRVYTFHLRPDARWSNGDPVTAHDFVYSWLRVLDPTADLHYAYLMYTLENGRAYAEGTVGAEEVGVQAADDHTLVVRLEEPVPFFIELTAFATFFPIHRGTVEALGAEAFLPENIVSNGPFQMASYERGNEVHLIKSPQYWDSDAIEIEHVYLRTYEDAEAALAAYLGGRVDWLPDLPWERLSSLRFRNDFHTHPMFGTYYYRFNLTDPIFADPRVRQALSLAIDREGLCAHVLDDLCQAARSFVPPMPNFEPVGILSFNPDRARELLSEAGYDGGQGLPPIRVTFNSLQLHQRVAEAVKEMWESTLNIQVELVEHPWDTYVQMLDDMDFQIARFGWIGDYLDPDSFLYLMVTDNVSMNGGWSNEGYDQLIREAAIEADPERRLEQFRAAETILLNELPIIPLYYYTQYQMIRPWIEGFSMNLRDVHQARYISRR